MTSYVLPVEHRGRRIGMLRGGQHFSSANLGKQESRTGGAQSEEHYDTPMGTQISIVRTLANIVKSIRSCCDTLETVEEFSSQRSELSLLMQRNTQLQQEIT